MLEVHGALEARVGVLPLHVFVNTSLLLDVLGVPVVGNIVGVCAAQVPHDRHAVQQIRHCIYRNKHTKIIEIQIKKIVIKRVLTFLFLSLPNTCNVSAIPIEFSSIEFSSIDGDIISDTSIILMYKDIYSSAFVVIHY